MLPIYLSRFLYSIYLFRKEEEKVEFSSPSLTVLVRRDLSGGKFGGFESMKSSMLGNRR